MNATTIGDFKALAKQYRESQRKAGMIKKVDFDYKKAVRRIIKKWYPEPEKEIRNLCQIF